MRLINADTFLDFIREIGKESEDKYGNTRLLISIDLKRVEELIEKQPTAYDVDKVVERITELTAETFRIVNDSAYIPAKKTLDIVKDGGINENS